MIFFIIDPGQNPAPVKDSTLKALHDSTERRENDTSLGEHYQQHC